MKKITTPNDAQSLNDELLFQVRGREAMTPTEQGQRDGGQWTDEQIKECGFHSAADCLASREQSYLDEMTKLPSLYAQNPEYAARQESYLNSLIETERQSLRNR